MVYNGADYCVNPDIGQGMWEPEWEKLANYYYTLLPKGKIGDVVHFGLGDWYIYKYQEGFLEPRWFWEKTYWMS